MVGQVIQTENLPGVPSYVSNHYQPSHISAAAGAMADLSLDVNVDPITAGKIREINKHKEAAVAKEDYDEAKRLKLAIERLKAVGQKVAQLEARKRQATFKRIWLLAMSHMASASMQTAVTERPGRIVVCTGITPCSMLLMLKHLRHAVKRVTQCIRRSIRGLQCWCRVAVEREDYDMAKALKQDIDKLRAAGEAAATGQIAEVPKSRRATDPEEIFNRVLGRWVATCPVGITCMACPQTL